MAAGWTRLAETEARTAAQRPFTARLRAKLAGGIAASVALGLRVAGAGRRVAARIWRSVTGEVDTETQSTTAAPITQSKVVSLANPSRHRRSAAVPHRTDDGARVVPIRPMARNEADDAVSTTTMQEEKVEQTRGREAADPTPPIALPNLESDWDTEAQAQAPGAEDAADAVAAEESEPGAEQASTSSDDASGAAAVDVVEATESEDAGAAALEEAPREAAAEDIVEAKESEPEEDDGSTPEDVSLDAAADEEAEGQDDGESESLQGERLDSIIESLLLAAGMPLTVRRICDVIRGGPLAKDVRASLRRLAEHYAGDRGIHLVEVGGAFQLRTAPANAKFVRALLREKPARLGRAALETLSIIAYKQPVTRGDIEAIRGVDADSAINTLLAQRLIKIDGRKEAVGRPLLYATTPEFLETFGLKDLKDLPTLKEIGPVPEPENDMDIEEEDDTVIAAAASEEEIVETVAMSENGAQQDGEETPVEAPRALGRNDDDDDEDFDDEDEDEEAEDDDFDDDFDEEDDGDDEGEDDDFDFDDEDEDEDDEDDEDEDY